jgi:hypothetical protein
LTESIGVNFREVEGWTVLQRVFIPETERGWAGVALWWKLRKDLAAKGVNKVLVSVELHNVKLALFLQHVLKAEPYGFSEGCVDMILEVHRHGKRQR